MSEKKQPPKVILPTGDVAEVPTRRVKTMLVNPLALIGLLTKGTKFSKQTQVIEGAPADAQIIGIAYDVRIDAILLVVESDEYEPIPINEQPPVQVISYRQGVIGATKKKRTPRKKK